MPPQHTRRALIQAIGGVSFTGLTGSATATSGESDESSDVAASGLVIPETAVPAGFEPHPSVESDHETAPLLKILQSLDPEFKSVETATSGFWKGERASNPQWALSSIALVGNDKLSRPDIEKATDLFYDGYIEEYDAETSERMEFEKSHSAKGTESDWKVDILEAPLPISPKTEPTPTLIERMHQRFLGNVFLGTVAFGPANGSPSVEALTEQFATIQRDRYDSVRNTQ